MEVVSTKAEVGEETATGTEDEAGTDAADMETVSATTGAYIAWWPYTCTIYKSKGLEFFSQYTFVY
jgi:hypothetical protein